jgi:hypothetical protein
MIYSNPYKEDNKTFPQIIKERIEYYDFYSGGQLEQLEQQLRSTQAVVMLISEVLTDEQKKVIAENLNYFPKR